MIITGFRDLEFLATGASGEGYSANLDDGFVGMPEIAVNVLVRPGALPTFAPLEVHEMAIPVTFIYHGSSLTIEQAFRQLWRRLDLFNRVPGQLRAQDNDGTKLVTDALIRLSGFTSFGDSNVNTRSVTFVSVSGWQTPTPSTTSGTF